MGGFHKLGELPKTSHHPCYPINQKHSDIIQEMGCTR